MSHRARHSTRRYTAAGAVLLAAGLIAITIALRAQQSAPQPPPSAASPVLVTPRTSQSSLATTSRNPLTPDHRTGGTPVGPILARSVPVRLDIPAIAVSSPLQQLGLNSDGTVQVPPLGCHSPAGWYTHSPTPGQLGPSIILGHIDSATCGPGVFFNLGKLRQRDTVSITLADHKVAVFEIEKVVEYPKANFPTLAVYGNTDHAALRLITCGGTFNPSAHSYESNIVAYAALVASHPS